MSGQRSTGTAAPRRVGHDTADVPAFPVRLRYWTRAFREVEFDPRRGRARRVRLARPRADDEPLHGFASAERSVAGRRHWFALYRCGDAIVFQAGGQRWHAGERGVDFRHVREGPFVSCFAVHVWGRCAFSLRYFHPLRTLFALVDPTYDKVDQDAEFLLEFVGDNAGDRSWRDLVLNRWEDAS